jgi:hypothetical protein
MAIRADCGRSVQCLNSAITSPRGDRWAAGLVLHSFYWQCLESALMAESRYPIHSKGIWFSIGNIPKSIVTCYSFRMSGLNGPLGKAPSCACEEFFRISPPRLPLLKNHPTHACEEFSISPPPKTEDRFEQRGEGYFSTTTKEPLRSAGIFETLETL